MKRETRVASVEELPLLARELIAFAERQHIKNIFFYGDLGSGKTTFIQHLCRELGCVDVVSSPTFALINEYACSGGKPVYHMDLYRLKSPEEARDIGVEEYLFEDAYCFVEWPELIEHLAQAGEALKIGIEIMPDFTRKFVLL